MAVYAKLRSEGVILVPVDPTTAADGELYRDENNSDSLTDKSTGGSDTQVGAASSDALLNKSKQNTSGSSIAKDTLVSLQSNGSIIPADSDGVNTQAGLAVTKEVIAPGVFGQVQLLAPNMKGVIEGLGFTPGQALYLNQDGSNRGFTANLGDLTDSNDSIIRIGYADCSDGEVSTAAKDIIAVNEIIARP